MASHGMDGRAGAGSVEGHRPAMAGRAASENNRLARMQISTVLIQICRTSKRLGLKQLNKPRFPRQSDSIWKKVGIRFPSAFIFIQPLAFPVHHSPARGTTVEAFSISRF